ncbi:ORF047 [Saltwater crocodilepox virus]|nr:serine/threonine protein kinase [Saltwater crocodilepox virus]AVD69382.1 serine/threonine protein kinase [Saltwater crocodilepox virus]QGT46702.1 ORF047 [Saltwater crocodilepox virus]QGT46919.1 ORF047 [Saltwater crocodilepox virus]QGT47132.1 ORF047 [Saltwater crocodilepox virus]
MSPESDVVEECLRRESDGEKRTILGNRLYFDNVYNSLRPSDFYPTKEQMVEYFRKNFTRNSLIKLTRTSALNPSYLQLRDDHFEMTNENDFYHLSTGGFGIVFRLHQYVVKFMYDFSERAPDGEYELASEYAIPCFLYKNLAGDERELLVRALAMGLNYDLSFLHRVYKTTVYLILLLYRVLHEKDVNAEYTMREIVTIFNAKKYKLGFMRLVSHFYPLFVRSNVNVINRLNYMINYFENEKRANHRYSRGNIIVFPLARFSADKINERNCAEHGFASLGEYVRFFFLQISLLYVKIYELPVTNFVHLDLKPDNILIFDSDRQLRVTLADGARFAFDEPIRCCLNDFDFSHIDQMPNVRVLRGKHNTHYNWFYDFHFLAHMILHVYPNLPQLDPDLVRGLQEFVFFCNHSTCEKFRLLVQKPYQISFLANFVRGDLFAKWRCEDRAAAAAAAAGNPGS